MRKNRWTLIFGALASIALTCQADVKHPLTSEHFSTKPESAEVTGNSCKAAKKYVDITNAGEYDKLGDLFAQDAIFLTPHGIVLEGRKAIGDFYSAKISAIKPDLVAVSYMSDGQECIMELVAATNLDNYAGYRLGAIDHFTVDKDGLITNLVVYVRPWAVPADAKKD